MSRFALLLVLLVAGCANYPRDPAGTLDRIRAERVFRVGIIAGDMPAAERAKVQAYLAAVSGETGARPQLSTGAAEPLLLRLKQGALDLVVGPLAADSPWLDDVSIIEPLAERREGEETVALSPIARNGENAWIMLLERAARDE
jgi:hypothetical protein